jgi:competence protein ComEC
VLRDFRPREIWEGVPVPPDALLNALRASASRTSASWRTLQGGQSIQIGRVELSVWHPPPPDWERQKVRNDDSLVLELRMGGVSVLLPGDISGEIERVVGPRLAPAAFRLLKVPHHGSASSSTRGFLSAARPDLAVLTVGRGTTIARDVIARYRDAGVTLLRTDSDGAVTMTTDGSSVEIRTFAGARLTLRVPPGSPEGARNRGGPVTSSPVPRRP